MTDLISNRIGFLRHAQIAVPILGDESPLQDDSFRFLRDSATDLALWIEPHEVRIFHSPAGKVKLSAEGMRDALSTKKEVASCEMLDWLTELELIVLDSSKSVVDAKFEELLSRYPDAFLIFVTHENGISAYVNVPSTQVLNCSFFSTNIKMKGHEPFETAN